MSRTRIVALLVLLAGAGAYGWFRGGGAARETGVGVQRRAWAPVEPSIATATAYRNGTAAVPVAPRLQMATFASGCFWCTESDFDAVAGVVSTTSGYTGGRTFRPSYQQVSSGGTGHVESLEVMFDPGVVTYQQLLDVYWHNVDPFNDRGQFCDYGEQYRAVIWVHGAAQRAAAEGSRAHIQQLFGKAVVVAIEEAGAFYPAEDYHQNFHQTHRVKYRFYRWSCGRDARLADIWRAVSE